MLLDVNNLYEREWEKFFKDYWHIWGYFIIVLLGDISFYERGQDKFIKIFDLFDIILLAYYLMILAYVKEIKRFFYLSEVILLEYYLMTLTCVEEAKIFF